jgi:hypothetical protein
MAATLSRHHQPARAIGVSCQASSIFHSPEMSRGFRPPLQPRRNPEDFFGDFIFPELDKPEKPVNS